MRLRNKFSRWMPPAPKPKWGFRGHVLLVTIVGYLVYLFYVALPFSLLVFVLVPLWMWISKVTSKSEARRLQAKALQRVGEDIGTFARAFNRRAEPFDTWVIRATWDTLIPFVSFEGGHVPLRPTDRLSDDIGIDNEQAYDAVYEVLIRTRRANADWKNNPFYPNDPVTIGDIVRLVSYQPLLAENP